MRPVHRLGWAALPVALAAGLAIAGCGTPGAPLPPSLKLPDQGDGSLRYPHRQPGLAHLDHAQKEYGQTAAEGQYPGARLPQSRVQEPAPRRAVCNWLRELTASSQRRCRRPLAAGAPRPLTYFVELTNHNGRSAGLSNDAVVLAGEAPGPVAGLTATGTQRRA